MKKFLAIAAVAATLTSTPAMAWGDREQGILAGVVLKTIWDHAHTTQPVVQQPPVVVHRPAPQPVIIHQNKHSWGSTRVCSEQIIRRPDGSQSTLQMNCAGRVVGEVIYNRY